MTTDPRYPIGKFEPQSFSTGLKREWLQEIQFLPGNVEDAIENLDTKQLDTPYREGGWTVRQVVHHLADTGVNIYTRFKLTLTEDNPTVKSFDEVKWAETPDNILVPVRMSITLLDALQTRLHAAIRDLDTNDWNRTFYHPYRKENISLWHLTGEYAFHGRHHVAQINALRERMGWVNEA
jgi:uncharacterized damage-inducible protein DinB